MDVLRRDVGERGMGELTDARNVVLMRGGDAGVYVDVDVDVDVDVAVGIGGGVFDGDIDRRMSGVSMGRCAGCVGVMLDMSGDVDVGGGVRSVAESRRCAAGVGMLLPMSRWSSIHHGVYVVYVCGAQERSRSNAPQAQYTWHMSSTTKHA